MWPLSRSPPEIVLQIFQSCSDFTEVLALASTCKHMHSVWTQNSQAVITETMVASLNVLNFRDALLAVRATSIVRKAFLAGTHVPPLFPFSELIREPDEPTLDELKLVLDFRYLVRCVEKMFLYGTKTRCGTRYQHYHPSEVATIQISEGSFDEDDWTQFRLNFHRAMYRVLLSGAVLYGAYNEPFVQTPEAQYQNEEFLRFATGSSLDEFGINHYPYKVSNEEIQYLSGFAVYNLHTPEVDKANGLKDEACEIIFGSLGKWIIQDGKERALQKAQEMASHDSDVEEEDILESMSDLGRYGSLEEILMIIAALEQLTNKIVNVDGTSRYFHRHTNIHQQDVFEGKTSRKVAVVLYGVFALEEIHMPAKSDDMGEGLLVARPIRPESIELTQGMNIPNHDSIVPHKFINIQYVMSRLHTAANAPSTRTEYPVAGPIYDFFVFTMRRYLDLKFGDDFMEGWPHSGYSEQISWGGALVDIDSYCFPFEEYTPPVQPHNYH